MTEKEAKAIIKFNTGMGLALAFWDSLKKGNEKALKDELLRQLKQTS